MKRIYFPERDTTLYERYPERNTGVDQILELSKIPSGSKLNGVRQSNSYVSRFIVDFGTQYEGLIKDILALNVPSPAINGEGVVVGSGSLYLELYASDATDLLHSYTLYANSVSESWDNGNGQFNNTPETKIGSSWYYRSGDAAYGTGIPWNTGSAHSKDTSAGSTETQGGGTWETGSMGTLGIAQASQSFVNQSPDIRMNITNLLALDWLQYNAPNGANMNGFIVRRPNTDELSQENFGSIKYFGRESHTIFIPRLSYEYDDSSTSGTLNAISSNTYVPYFKNIKPEYRTSETTRFRIGVRPEFPTKAYQTSSFYITNDHLPISSSYEIIDSVTDHVILKDETEWGDSMTKISYDVDSSFFDLRMDSFLPERYYKIKLTCRRTNDTQTFDDFYFKVVK